MAIMAEAKGGDFKEAEVGTHAARCWQLIDLGHQTNVFEGEEKTQHQILLSWELPNQDRLEDGRPVSISKFYTLSLHDKSNLAQDLAGWRGKAFTEEEKKGFDVTKLVGVPCMLSVIEKKGKSKVGGVMSMPKGMACPDPVNTPVIFDLQDYIAGKTAVFDSLSDGLKKLILKAREFDDLPEGTDERNPPPANAPDEFDDSNIPF